MHIYVRRYFERNKTQALRLLAVFSMFVFCLTLISVFLDSSARGETERALERYGSAAVTVLNLTEEQAELFAGIAGADMRYASGTLYISVEGGKNDAMRVLREVKKIRDAYAPNLMIGDFTDPIYSPKSSSPGNALPFKIFFILIQLFPLSLTVRMALKSQEDDIALMRSVGISPSKINRLLTAELMSVYIVSLIIGIAAGNLFVGLVAKYFFNFAAGDFTFSRMVYRFSFLSTLRTALGTTAVFFAALQLAIYRISRREDIFSKSYYSLNPPKPGSEQRLLNIAPQKLISEVYIKRDVRIDRAAAVAAVPVIAVSFLFIFYCGADAAAAVDSFVLRGHLTYKDAYLTKADIEDFEALPCVDSVDWSCRNNNFQIKAPYGAINAAGYGDNYYVSLKTFSNNEIEELKSRESETGNIFSEGSIYAEGKFSEHFPVGETVELYSSDGKKIKDVIVAGYCGKDKKASSIMFYCTRENYELIAGEPPLPTDIKITAKKGTTDSELDELRGLIAEKCAGKDISVTDTRRQYLDSLKLNRALTWIFFALCFCLIFTSAVIIIQLQRLKFELRREQYSTYRLLGGTGDVIFDSMLRENLSRAGAALFAGAFFGLLPVVAMNLIYGVPVSLFSVSFFALTLAVLLLAYLIPLIPENKKPL